MTTLLTNRQKYYLSTLAKRAYDHVQVQDESIDDWRRRVALNRCGITISSATQDQYNDLQVCYMSYLPAYNDKIFNIAMQDEESNKIKQAKWRLNQEIKTSGLTPQYAEKLAQSKYKRAIENLDRKQLWTIIFTIVNRRKKI
jgi:hypothetical protein